MKLIGLLLNLAAITATAIASHHEHDGLTLSPSHHTVVRYTNESLMVQCRSPTPEVQLHWKSPKGELIKQHKGRIHVEQSTPEILQIVFAHISLADKGNWTCEDVAGNKPSKSFQLIVYQKITFTENATIITVKEGKTATIYCEVKGEPQPNITWSFNGQPITAETNISKFRILADGLLINNVTQNDTGEYTCRAFQVNTIASDMQERTVLMKIEHKPFWTHKHHLSQQYAYPNGTTTITCEAIAEPPAKFIWHRNKTHLQNNKYYSIESGPYHSTLTIHVLDQRVFGAYNCSAQNHVGSIQRTTYLDQGTKPPTPAVLQLRGRDSHQFVLDFGPVRAMHHVKSPMDVTGYRAEYMTKDEFKKNAGNWTYAKRKDFEIGYEYLIQHLEQNSTYLVRAASKNLAGFSDWTKVTEFETLTNVPPSSAATLMVSMAQLLLPCMLSYCLNKALATGWQFCGKLW